MTLNYPTTSTKIPLVCQHLLELHAGSKFSALHRSLPIHGLSCRYPIQDSCPACCRVPRQVAPAHAGLNSSANPSLESGSRSCSSQSRFWVDGSLELGLWFPRLRAYCTFIHLSDPQTTQESQALPHTQGGRLSWKLQAQGPCLPCSPPYPLQLEQGLHWTLVTYLPNEWMSLIRWAQSISSANTNSSFVLCFHLGPSTDLLMKFEV